MKILIIGGGNMGLTYAKAFINSHVVTPKNLMILEKAKADYIAQLESLNIASIHTDLDCIKDADLIVLAVKPQDAITLFEHISAYLNDEQLVLSIMAGIKLSTMQKHLKIQKIIRAMPNLPAQIGMGMTAFSSTEAVSRLEQGLVQNLLATTGKTLNLDNEDLIDTVTAISGSGPAYIYYFMDAMIKAGIDMGMQASEAELLVKQTFDGALNLYQQNRFSCQEWIDKVSSKGGTTEAAINFFNQHQLNEIIAKGTKAAYERSVSLGK